MTPKKDPAGGGTRKPPWKWGNPVPRSFFDILEEKDPDGQERQDNDVQADPGPDPAQHEE